MTQPERSGLCVCLSLGGYVPYLHVVHFCTGIKVRKVCPTYGEDVTSLICCLRDSLSLSRYSEN
jgi:hypothetical protein